MEQLRESDPQVVGDIRQIKISIDVGDMDFVTTLLSSSLYSDPIGSFLREMVSNAWDAHVEAHNTGDPVIVRLHDGRITVRDYGTGLGREDFEDLYCKIGRSTRRESNEYIGGWGLGKFSGLAMSDVVYVRDYHGGFRADYVMVKEGNTITISEMGVVPTDERDGLEVTVEFDPVQLDKVRLALVSLVFFPNVYVDYGDYAVALELDVNKAVVTRYRHFSVSSILKYSEGGKYPASSHKCWVLLGNVLYPLDLSKLDRRLVEGSADNMRAINLCLNVPIGGINVTPNREQIQYTEATVGCLNRALEDALGEIGDITGSMFRMDYDDIVAYKKAFSSKHYWDPVSNVLDGGDTPFGHCWEITCPEVTYRGVRRSGAYNSAVAVICNLTVPGFRNYYDGGSMRTSQGLKWEASCRSTCGADKFLAIEGDKPMTGYVRKYVTSHVECQCLPIISVMPREEFGDAVVRAVCVHPGLAPVYREVAGEFHDRIRSRTKVISLKAIGDYGGSHKVGVQGEKGGKGLYSLHKWDPFDECTRDIRLTDSPVSFARIVELLKARHGRCVFHNGSRISDGQSEDYWALMGMGYEILWGTSRLYDALLRYKEGSGELGFLVFDYRPLLDNPDKNAQINLVLGRYVTMRVGEDKDKHLYGVVSDIEEFLDPEFVRFHELALGRIRALRVLNDSNFARRRWEEGFPLTDPTARWLWGYVRKVTRMAAKYHGILGKLNSYGIHNRYLSRYLWCRWCFRNHLKLRYRAYVDMLGSSLLEMIFKEKGL